MFYVSVTAYECTRVQSVEGGARFIRFIGRCVYYSIVDEYVTRAQVLYTRVLMDVRFALSITRPNKRVRRSRLVHRNISIILKSGERSQYPAVFATYCFCEKHVFGLI